MPSNATRWEEKTEKIGEKWKSIKVSDKSLEGFAKILARLQEKRFLA